MVRMMQPMKKNVEVQGVLPRSSKVPYQYRSIMKDFEAKHASAQFRHDLLLRQRNANYVGEHNRITGILGTLVPGMADGSIQRIRDRQANLTRLVRTGLGPEINPFVRPN
jgi:hypothetical protein